ncbi:MAG: sugar phosphate isomerase/epimerase [Chloroflexota bacterium]
MKIAIQTNVWSDQLHKSQLPSVLAEIARAGYQGFETGAHRVDLEQPAAFRKLADQHGLQVAGIHTHGELYNPQAMLEAQGHFRKIAHFAAEAGADCILFSGKVKEDKTEDDLQNECQALEHLGGICASHNLAFCYHNHYWEIEHNLRELRYLCDHTNPALVSLALDVGWVHRAGGSPSEVTRLLLDRIGYFHFKDFRVKNFHEDTWTELGDGYVNFPAILETLQGRWEGWIAVERDETLPNAFESARASRAYLKSILG